LLLAFSSGNVGKNVVEVPLHQGISVLIEGFLFEANTHLPQGGNIGLTGEEALDSLRSIKDTVEIVNLMQELQRVHEDKDVTVKIYLKLLDKAVEEALIKYKAEIIRLTLEFQKEHVDEDVIVKIFSKLQAAEEALYSSKSIKDKVEIIKLTLELQREHVDEDVIVKHLQNYMWIRQ